MTPVHILVTGLLIGYGANIQATMYRCTPTDTDGQVLYTDTPCSQDYDAQRITDQQLNARTSISSGSDATTINVKTISPQNNKLPSSRPPLKLAFLYVGFGLFVIGSIWLILSALLSSWAWGLACLLLLPATWLYSFKHWKKAKRPFLLQSLGLGMLIVSHFAL